MQNNSEKYPFLMTLNEHDPHYVEISLDDVGLFVQKRQRNRKRFIILGFLSAVLGLSFLFYLF